MTAASNGRRLPFSLLAVLLVFAALVIRLGLVSQKVRERQRAAQTTPLYLAEEYNEADWQSYHHPSIPWYRKIMGDRVYTWVQVDDSATDEELANAERLFPEAWVVRNRCPNPNYFPESYPDPPPAR